MFDPRLLNLRQLIAPKVSSSRARNLTYQYSPSNRKDFPNRLSVF